LGECRCKSGDDHERRKELREPHPVKMDFHDPPGGRLKNKEF